MKTTSLHRLGAVAAALLAAGAAGAAPSATSPYRTDAQSTHVEDATSKGISQVNMITCIMTSMRPDALVNQGRYGALVDQKKCDPQARADSGNSGSDSAGANAPAYLNAIVESTRASNADPMRVKSWIDLNEGDFTATIFVNTSATEAPSESNPYGVFRIDYCGRTDGLSSCIMNGYLSGSAGGIEYFETDGDPSDVVTTALRLTKSGSDSGAGALGITEFGVTSGYRFAYNGSLFRRSDGVADQCFSRLADDPDTGMSVWRYGLYDAATGERVVRRSGFPIEFAGAGGRAFQGQIGYHGLWLPPEARSQAVHGATVQRVEYVAGREPTRTPYTLVKSDGRLVKYTRQTRTLASADRIRFNVHVGDATGFYPGALGNRQYEMLWDDASRTFKATGTIECGPSGCQTRDLSSEQTVAVSYFATQGGVRGWSQSLGGELFVPLAGVSSPVDSAAVPVIYRVQDLVYPAQMPATLHCLRECPTAASMQAFFAENSTAASPFVAATFNRWQPAGPEGVVSYTTDASAVLLKDGAGAAVVFTDADALARRPQYPWGVRTGRLFTTLDDARCPEAPSLYCDRKVDELEVYYQWETGPNTWNQFAAVKDAAGSIVTFEAPLQVSYTVPAGAAYGAYAGKSIVLQYGGWGDLWGIPGHCVSRVTNERVSCETPESRYVPAFVIPFDEVQGRVAHGATPYLVKWLDREIRFARKPVSQCTDAGIALPATLSLPTASGLANPSDPASPAFIGAKPASTGAPRVIHGEVKY